MFSDGSWHLGDDCMKNKKLDNRGQLFIEAAIVYPLMMIILAVFLFVMLVAAQRMQFVAAAEQTMTYQDTWKQQSKI